MAFLLPELTYDYSALEPIMDAKTVEVHHDKHHATYTSKLNEAIGKHSQYFTMTIEEILNDLSKIPDDIRPAVRNHGGGFYHHNLWWEQLAPNKGGKPTGTLANAIDQTFGGFNEFRNQLNAASITVFGSGWGWLCKNTKGELVITTTPNQDSPLSQGLNPILTIDVWEHAYYLKYQNRRNEFVEAVWDLIDWDKVTERYV